jgi:hypothetical protein
VVLRQYVVKEFRGLAVGREHAVPGPVQRDQVDADVFQLAAKKDQLLRVGPAVVHAFKQDILKGHPPFCKADIIFYRGQ